MRYTELRRGKHFRERPATALRCIDRLRALRARLAATVPPKSTEQTLLLATWNLRDFGRDRYGHGWRSDEAYHYIAQIISAFDLVALQEIGGDLEIFRGLEHLLGPAWDFVVTDVTEGVGGNGERMCFVYDTRKVRFRNIAGEIVLTESDAIGGFATSVKLPAGSSVVTADGRRVDPGDGARLELPAGQTLVDRLQFARTPFLVAFQAGWFKFNLCTVHLYYGDDSGERFERRVQEIGRIAKVFVDRQKREKKDLGAEENYILLGDFNINDPSDRTMRALSDQGYEIPEVLQQNPTNMLGTRHYDQIAFRARPGQLRLARLEGFQPAGVVDFYKTVYRASRQDDVAAAIAAAESDFSGYEGELPEARIRDLADEKARRRYYARTWRTWQMSDHLPMWVALEVDFADDYLDATEAEARARLGGPR